MSDEPGAGGGLEAAVQRLDRAMAKLELRMSALLADAGDATTGLFEQDRAQLAADLDRARGREKELEAAGRQASQALGRAIAEIRHALGEDETARSLSEEA